MASTIDEPQILFVCGSPERAEALHRIANELGECRVWFTAYYGGPLVTMLRELGLLEHTAAGKGPGERCLRYLRSHHLPIDLGGRRGRYDLIVTSSDLVLPANVRGHRLVVVGTRSVQRTVAAERFMWRIAQGLSRWLGTDPRGARCRVCVASNEDRDFFLDLGVSEERIVATGVPGEEGLGPAEVASHSAAERIACVCRELLGPGESEAPDSAVSWRALRAA